MFKEFSRISHEIKKEMWTNAIEAARTMSSDNNAVIMSLRAWEPGCWLILLPPFCCLAFPLRHGMLLRGLTSSPWTCELNILSLCLARWWWSLIGLVCSSCLSLPQMIKGTMLIRGWRKWAFRMLWQQAHSPWWDRECLVVLQGTGHLQLSPCLP